MFTSRVLKLRIAGFSLLLLCAGLQSPAAKSETQSVGAREVLNHLNTTISWYEHVNAAVSPLSTGQNVLLENSVRQSSRQVVIQAFAFARAQAALLGSSASEDHPAASDHTRNLQQSAAAAAQRIQRLQGLIDELNQQIAKTPRRKLPILTSQRDALGADLAFATLAQNSLKGLLHFANEPEEAGGLPGQIDLLAGSDSIPAALSNSAPAPAPQQTNAAASMFHPESAGIAPLIADCFEILRTRSRVDSLLAETHQLSLESQTLLSPLRTQLRAVINQGDALAAATLAQTDPKQLAATRQQMNLLSVHFKSLSGPIVPLSEQGIAQQTTRAALDQWRDALNRQLQTVAGYLAVRLGSFALAVVVLLIASRIVHRATLRYVKDTRRRRQFVLIRRFVVISLATLIAVFASVSGIGSFATVAGFVTAGLAVALQNVILSVVAYFFLIGRYGLRTGDRVTVSNVTGKVIEVGLVRLYLMELAGSGTDIHATGRVAVFSNSVIFQPAALIKQAPGTDYSWHTVSTTLVRETNLEECRSRIARAVESVYQSYQPDIQKQHEAFERDANIQIDMLAPVSRAHYTDSGIEVTVRYPVSIREMSKIDGNVIEAVMRETINEPQLKLASGGFPKVLPTT